MDGDSERTAGSPASPAGPADSSGSAGSSGPAVLTGLTAAAREGGAAENRAAAQRLVACYALLQECWR
ncbi:hypothetical protein, partial [Dietzia massiliensis]|uniref:hypothetical protein n=1 Tax=Dietzia massiliensis TaxID=2697499 RepID=UPI001BD0A958